MNTRTAVSCCLLVLSGLSSAPAQNARSTSEGVFTVEQAKRGEKAFNSNCAGCHGVDLKSTDREVPNLTGDSFKRGWVGKSAGEVFELIRDTMPPRDERSLPDAVYLDVMTYILQFNKVPAGTRELQPDPGILKQVRISDPG